MSIQVAGGIAALVLGILLLLLLLPGIPDTLSGIIKRPIRTDHWEKSTRYSIFTFGALLILVGLFSTLSPSLDGFAGVNVLRHTERIDIQTDYYHIGDVECTWGIKDGQLVKGQCFSHPSPQENPFGKEFLLDQLPVSAVLHLSARSIDPDEKRSPIKLFINGTQVDFLNRHFTAETMGERSASIRLDISVLREGKNTFQIFVEPTNLTPIPNTDDIEFWDVYIEVVY